MRVLMLDAPQSMLDERRALGLDKKDEMWDGVLHMVPPAGDAHQGMSIEFFEVVGPLARAKGLVPRLETGLFRSDDDYRVPDQLYRRPDQGSERGAEGAELVVEVRSPRDESFVKLRFYAAVGVGEVLVLHPADRRAELFRLIDGNMLPISPDPAGGLHSEALSVTLSTVEGKLRIAWADGSADI